jgi:hypothetical protein
MTAFENVAESRCSILRSFRVGARSRNRTGSGTSAYLEAMADGHPVDIYAHETLTPPAERRTSEFSNAMELGVEPPPVVETR